MWYFGECHVLVNEWLSVLYHVHVLTNVASCGPLRNHKLKNDLPAFPLQNPLGLHAPPPKKNYMLNIIVLKIKSCLMNSQTFKIISLVESFLCPDKQRIPDEGRRIQRLKRCVLTNTNKDSREVPVV